MRHDVTMCMLWIRKYAQCYFDVATLTLAQHKLFIGTGAANQLLRPFIETAQLWTLHFDTTHLVNFHEKLLFAQPVAAKKVKPLIVNPGSLMLTETRVYFQPAQLNNIGMRCFCFCFFLLLFCCAVIGNCAYLCVRGILTLSCSQRELKQTNTACRRQRAAL